MHLTHKSKSKQLLLYISLGTIVTVFCWANQAIRKIVITTREDEGHFCVIIRQTNVTLSSREILAALMVR